MVTRKEAGQKLQGTIWGSKYILTGHLEDYVSVSGLRMFL